MTLLAACSTGTGETGPTSAPAIGAGTAAETVEGTAGPPAGADDSQQTATLADDAGVTTAPPVPEVEIAGSLGGAGELVRDFYLGEKVPADEAVSTALPAALRAEAARELVSSGQGARTVEGARGTWGRTTVAVLTSGDDVTLALSQRGEWRIVGGWWPSLGVDEPVPGGQRTVLLIGSDARPGEAVDRARADAIQLVATDGNGAGGVLGLARDSWVPIPGHGSAKVNAAMVYGGPSLLVETVEQAGKLELDGYLLVGFEEFKAVIKDSGGLPFVLAQAQRALSAQLPEGEQTLSGSKALALARERQALPDGDFGRSRHQGSMVLAALELAQEAGPQGLPGLMSVLGEHAQTDLSATQALLLLAETQRVDPDQIGHGVVQGPSVWIGGQSAVQWDQESRDLLRDLRDGALATD